MTKTMSAPTMLMRMLTVVRMAGMAMVMMMVSLVVMLATMSIVVVCISIMNSYHVTGNIL